MRHDVERRPMTDEVWHRAALLERLIERLGVASAAARLEGGQALLAAHDCCLDCASPSACLLVLEQAGEVAAPQQCPNADFLHRCLAAEQLRAEAVGRLG